LSSRRRRARAAWLVVAATLACGSLPAPASAQTIRTGTGFSVSTATHIVTNAHVAEGCRTLRVLQGSASAPARLVALDNAADLALLRSDLRTPRIAALRGTPPLRVGEPVVSFGFPLSGALSKEGNLTTGNVSALAGLRDDPAYLQMTAPVQPGNSGGPLLDASAHVIGVVTAKLDAVAIAKRTGDIPQNVNFAIKAEVLRTLLRGNGVPFDEEASDRTIEVADIAELARGFTVQVECVPGRGILPEPGRVEVTPRPIPPPTSTPPEPPAAAPNAPTPVVADADREQMLQQVQLIGVRTPYPGTAPETREIVIANHSERSIYKVTVGWLDQALQRCPSSSSAYSGRREIHISVKAGEQGKTLADFPVDAKLFCVVDAAFLQPMPPRPESSLIPAQPQAPASAPPAATEEAAPAPAAPAPPPPASEPVQPKAPRAGPGRQ
jgi:Trypsin-like peptidase domain